MHYQRSKIYKTLSKILLPLLPAIIAFVLIVGDVSMPPIFRDVGIRILSPFWSLKRAHLHNPADIAAEACMSLQRASFALRALEQDNKHLRELLGRALDTESLFVSAAVLYHARYAPYGTFIIDRGMHDGMREGMIVTSAERVAVGYITKVHSKTSTVTLFSASSKNFNAVMQGESNLHIELFGQGSGSMRAVIPRDMDAREGESLVLPFFETYVVGTIASVEVMPEDAYKTLFVRAPINTFTLRYVLVDTVHVWRPDEE